MKNQASSSPAEPRMQRLGCVHKHKSAQREPHDRSNRPTRAQRATKTLKQTADNSKELQDFKTKCHKDISPIYTRTIRNRMFGYNWSTSLSLFCSRPTDK